MSLRFILGPSGSGKSTYIMRQLATALKENPRKKIILLLPEQATFCYQYELINHYGLQGVLTLQILSFQRLARIVMQETGGLSRQIVNELGKMLILRRLLSKEAEAFPYLRTSLQRTGYLQKIGGTFDDFKKYRLTGGMLQDIVSQQHLPETLFAHKLDEMTRLYGKYEQYLGQDLLDTEDPLNLLVEKLPQAHSLHQTEVWIDEFYSFTPQELAVIEQLLCCLPQVHIALTIDPHAQNPARRAAFHTTQKTYGQISQCAISNHIEIQQPLLLSENKRQSGQEDLCFLEAHYFQTGKQIYTKKPEHLKLIQGQNLQSEVDFAAREIRRLCREEGYRYQEIGIFIRNLADYELLFETVLLDYDIPFFLDQKLPFHQHPITELLLSVFSIFSERWSYQSMFRYLKTNLLSYPLEALDRLENYVLQYGIRGAVWYREEPWHWQQREQETKEDLEVLDALRREIALPLVALQEKLCEKQTAAAIIQHLYQFFEQIGLARRLEVLCEEAREQGQITMAQTNQQIWDKLVEIFNQMTEILADVLLTPEEFAALLTTAFANLDLGLLPSSLDQVFIGSLTHSRNRNLRAAFILGLNEGIFPAPITSEGFFSELELKELQKLGIVFVSASTERLYEEQLAIYLALCKGSERLYLSYALSDEEGKGRKPSAIVDRVCSLFPAFQTKKGEYVQWPPTEDVADFQAYFNHPRKVLGLLGSHLKQVQSEEETQEVWHELYNWFLDRPTRLFQTIQQSLKHQQHLKPKRLLQADLLYGNPLHLSVSAIERYRNCPYSYFLQRGLRIRERNVYKIENVDIGQFYHETIERFSKYLLEQQIDWQDLDRQRVEEIITEIVDKLAPQLQNEILLSSGRYRYIKHTLRRTAVRSACVLMEHGKQGEFIPVAFEADFGPHKEIPGLTIQLMDGTRLQLEGRIDRVEEAIWQSTHYLRIIDFKTGQRNLTLMEIFYGLKIQLLTYLQVMLAYYEKHLPDSESVSPAGVLYYFFRNQLERSERPLTKEEAQQLSLQSMMPQGLITADLVALKLADRELTTGKNKLLPVYLLKEALPYLAHTGESPMPEDPLSLFRKGSQSIVTPKQLEQLLWHILLMIKDTGNAIRQGDISISPCLLKQFSGCQFCHFQAICQIETKPETERYRQLPELSAEQIWNHCQQYTKFIADEPKEGKDSDDEMDHRTGTGHS